MTSSTAHSLLQRVHRKLMHLRHAVHPVSFTARLERDPLDGGWIAECIELPGCMSEGDTEQEAIDNLIDAIGEVLAARMHMQEPTKRKSDDAKHNDDTREVALCV